VRRKGTHKRKGTHSSRWHREDDDGRGGTTGATGAKRSNSAGYKRDRASAASSPMAMQGGGEAKGGMPPAEPKRVGGGKAGRGSSWSKQPDAGHDERGHEQRAYGGPWRGYPPHASHALPSRGRAGDAMMTGSDTATGGAMAMGPNPRARREAKQQTAPQRASADHREGEQGGRDAPHVRDPPRKVWQPRPGEG
jgi:hypothetical protein